MSEEMSTPTQPQEGKKKSKSFWSAILIPALIFGISDVVGERLGEAAVDTISEKREVSKIEQFTELTKEYIPGTLTEDSYSSEYWDLQFQADGPWLMADEAEREALSQGVIANAKSGAAASMQDDDISQELKDAYLDSIYGATEMYAMYVDEEGYCVGEANITVVQFYGTDELDEQEYLQGVAEGLSSQYENVTLSEVTLAGKSRNCIEFYAEQDGMVLQARCIYMVKGITSCLIRITYLDGYEDVYTSFLAQLSAYN